MAVAPKEFHLSFLKQEQRAKDTISFFFDASKEQLEFTAGQYIKMFLTPKQDDPRGNYRSFSICSSPDQKNILMITSKVIGEPSLFKQKLSSLNQGEMVRFFGPLGAFILPEKSERPLVFLAGGIGITPFHSMLLHAAISNYPTPLTLFASFSTVEEAAFYEELTQIANDHPMIKVIYTITHPEESQSSWSGETGRISQELLQKYIKDIHEPNYMLCGPTPMVTAMLDLLQDLKVPPEQVKEEQFTGY